MLAAEYRYRSVLELEGALEGFRHVNLDAEGLSEYRAQLLALGIRDLGASGEAVGYGVSSSSQVTSFSQVSLAAGQIFDMIDVDRSGTIEVAEAEKIVLRLNSRLNRAYGENEVNAFFAAAASGSQVITREQFLRVFEKLAQ